MALTNEEDYLDGLLSSITQKKSDIEEQKSREESDLRKKYEESTRLSPDDDFLKETGLSDYRPSAVDRKNLRQAFSESGFLSDFEKTLSDGTADDFIKDFERELEDDELSGSSSEAELSAFLDDEKRPEKEVVPAGVSSGGSSDQENFNLDFSPSPLQEEPLPDISTVENPDEQLLSNIDEIVKNAKMQVEEGALVPPDDSDLSTPQEDSVSDDLGFISNLDIFGGGGSDTPSSDSPSDENNNIEPDLSAQGDSFDGVDESALSAASELENLFPDGDTSAKEVSLMDEEGADQDLLNILGKDGEFSDIGDLLTADANQEALPEAAQEFEAKASSVSPGGDGSLSSDVPVSEEDGEGKKKGGFLGKLKGLFKKKKKGEEEAGDKGTPAESAEPVNINPINPSAAELSSETNDLLAEFGELPEASNPEASEEPKEEGDGKKKKKEKKKKGKKGKGEGEEGEGDDSADKKAEKKKQAAEKKAAKKAAKEAEKAADTSPVIPKKTIIVFAIFGISVAVFVTVLSKTISSKLLFSAAEAAYNKGEYNEAYTKFSGLELKGDDVLYLDRSRILGTLDLHLKQYEVSMKYKKYDMALDSLIMGIESYEKNKEYAAELSISEVYDSFGKRIENQLKDQFTLSKEEAHNIYNSKSRVEYSIRINRKLRELKLIEDPFKEEIKE